jgi:hypothetical protein
LFTDAETVLTVKKGIDFDGGGSGTDGIEFGNQGLIKLGRSASGQSVVFIGGSGADTLSIGANGVVLNGSVEMSGGGGNDVVDIDGVKVSVGRSASGNSVLLTGGAGNDEIDIQGAKVAIAGHVRLDGGSEADFLDLTNVHALSVKGSIELNGGGGVDVLELETGNLRLNGNLHFAGDDDADRVSIEADGRIGGSVELLAGGGFTGVQEIEIRGLSGLANSLKVAGGLTVDAAGAMAADIFRLTNVQITKGVSLVFGDGVSDVDIDNLQAASTLLIETRAGADDLRIETDAVYGTSRIAQQSTVSLGEGDDLLELGRDSRNNRLLMLARLTVDGGSGTDARNDILGQNEFSGQGSLTSSGFEEENR